MDLDDRIKSMIGDESRFLFTSFHSQYLPIYAAGIIDARTFDTDESLMAMGVAYVRNYRRVLTTRFVHLGSLAQAGVHNPKYDVTCCFDQMSILPIAAHICDHETLAAALLYGVSVDGIFKNDYEYGDEVLVRQLDIREAQHVIVYTPDACKAVCSLFERSVSFINRLS